MSDFESTFQKIVAAAQKPKKETRKLYLGDTEIGRQLATGAMIREPKDPENLHTGIRIIPAYKGHATKRHSASKNIRKHGTEWK